MRPIIAVVAALAAWYPIGKMTYELTRNEPIALLVATAGSVLLFWLIYSKLPIGEKGLSAVSSGVGKMRDAKERFDYSLEGSHTDLYAVAEEEYENGDIDKGLWSQALIKAKGNEGLRKIEYMKLRVRKLKQENSE